MRWLFLLLLMPAMAYAQMPDFCGKPLTRQMSNEDKSGWMLRCTIQRLQAERVHEADRATQDEVEIARLGALLKSAEAEIDKLRKARSK